MFLYFVMPLVGFLYFLRDDVSAAKNFCLAKSSDGGLAQGRFYEKHL